MPNNILVCGGLPRSGTTFLYTELCNYSNVFESTIKESYLFERSDRLIDLKLRTLRNRRLCLDFTPEYIFRRSALEKILARNVNCFFIVRDFDEYRNSLTKYLTINKIRNDFLMNISEAQFDEAVRFARKNFATYSLSEVSRSPDAVVRDIEKVFGLDFGERKGNKENRNPSSDRRYYFLSFFHNRLETMTKVSKSLLFGVM